MTAQRILELAGTAPLRAPRVAGVDEAGRGPLAGPVVAAAVILDPAQPIDGLRDSKQLPAGRRYKLEHLIRCRALAFAIGEASVEEIDRLNILQASLLAMRRAVVALAPAADLVLVDGLHLPAVSMPARAIVRGDTLEPAISAASILAKTHRDRLMLQIDRRFPQYGFARHFGYPTPEHLARLGELGACDVHRRSFAPVRAAVRALG